MKNNNKGLTLIELIVAIAILGIISIGFLPVFFSAYRQIILSGQRSETLHDAQNLNELKVMDGAISTADEISFVFADSNGLNQLSVDVSGEHIQNGSLQMFIPE